jgi:outer membrane protein TolC
MRPTQIFIYCLVITACLGMTGNAETISQDDFLNRLKQTYPLFEKEKLSIQSEQKRRESLLGGQDWNVRSSLFLIHDEPAISAAGPERTDALLISGGLEKAVWSTGGRLSASFSSTIANLKIDPFLGVPDSYFENQLVVTYSLPLMRNHKGMLDRLQFELSKFDIDLSQVMAVENEEVFLFQAANKYLDWVLLVEQQKIVVERLHLSEAELKRAQDKREANLIDEVDVIRAENAVTNARQNLLVIKSKTGALQSELAVLLQDSSFIEMSPDYDIYEMPVLPSLTEAITSLKSDSRLLKALAIKIDQKRLLKSGFEEQSRKDLSVFASVGLGNAESSYGRSLVIDKPSAMIGLQYNFPVENRTAKANVSRTDIQIMQLEKQVEEIDLELSAAITNLLTQATELVSVLELDRKQIESARAKTQEELKIYNQGRGELTFVIQSRDSEQAAKLAYAANALTYHKLLLQLLELTDQLYE